MPRIEVHVKGIRNMIDDDKSYPEIVQHISAVKGALDSVVEVIVQDLVEHCVSQTSVDTPARNAALELRETVSNIL